MISSSDFQIEYNNLYSVMRNYIWNFQIVEYLADLEIACYDACVEISNIRDDFYRLRNNVMHVYNRDEEFKQAFDDFESLLNEADGTYTTLYKVKEEIQNNEDNEE